MTERYVLDACALLALLNNEKGADVVADVINAANNDKTSISMHKANLLEVYYDVFRSVSKSKADEVFGEIKNSPVNVISEISDAVFEEAGRLKALHKISFADTFALATASVNNATLLTADHHEMDKVKMIEKDFKFLWIR